MPYMGLPDVDNPCFEFYDALLGKRAMRQFDKHTRCIRIAYDSDVWSFWPAQDVDDIVITYYRLALLKFRPNGDVILPLPPGLRFSRGALRRIYCLSTLCIYKHDWYLVGCRGKTRGSLQHSAWYAFDYDPFASASAVLFPRDLRRAPYQSMRPTIKYTRFSTLQRQKQKHRQWLARQGQRQRVLRQKHLKRFDRAIEFFCQYPGLWNREADVGLLRCMCECAYHVNLQDALRSRLACLEQRLQELRTTQYENTEPRKRVIML